MRRKRGSLWSIGVELGEREKMGKVDFSGEIFSTLAEGGKSKYSLSELEGYTFPEWDVLRELERRGRRAERERNMNVREWMRLNPEKVEEIRRRHEGP